MEGEAHEAALAWTILFARRDAAHQLHDGLLVDRGAPSMLREKLGNRLMAAFDCSVEVDTPDLLKANYRDQER